MRGSVAKKEAVAFRIIRKYCGLTVYVALTGFSDPAKHVTTAVSLTLIYVRAR